MGFEMKILLYDMGAFTQNDLIHCLNKRGISYRNVYYKFRNIYEDDFFCRRFATYLTADDYDFVLSINFFPLVARLCHEHGIRYLSWSYDSPLSNKKYDFFHYPTNDIFIFDRLECERLKKQGFDSVHHLPLGVSVDRLGAVVPGDADMAKYSCDVSLVGQIYQSQLAEIKAPLSEYDKGFIDSITAAQRLLYGCYFVDELLSAELIERIRVSHARAGQEIDMDQAGLSIAIATQIAASERLGLLELMGRRFRTLLFSRHVPAIPEGVSYLGAIGYFDEMPKIFKLSKINLNPTLRSIRSGIPLRALDILGSGALLLSNYQHELVEHFIPGEEVVVYESIEDAAAKAEYYIRHDDERDRIAQNGRRKLCEHFSFDAQLQKMFAMSRV